MTDTLDADEAYLDKLERRQRRARLTPKPVKPRKSRAETQGPIHGPPAPPAFTRSDVQAKAAASRVGLRNAATTDKHIDEVCEAILNILKRLNERSTQPNRKET